MRHRDAPTYLNIATIAIIILIAATESTINKAVISPIATYFNAVWSGNEDPFWPHIVLVPLSVAAGLAVGFAIFADHPRFSRRFSAATHTFALWCLIVGVPTESICTVLLFVIDERISISQQSTIIDLERRIAPREISKYNKDVIAGLLKVFPKPIFDICVTPGVERQFIYDMRDTLVAAGWTLHNFGGPQTAPEALTVPKGFDPGIGVCGLTDVEIIADPSLEKEFAEPVGTLVTALRYIGIKASAFTVEGNDKMRADTIHIEIGNRL